MGMPANSFRTCKPSTAAKLALALRSLVQFQVPPPALRLQPTVPELLVVSEMPPVARTRNWLATVAAMGIALVSDQTKSPLNGAFAWSPAAKLSTPAAELL